MIRFISAVSACAVAFVILATSAQAQANRPKDVLKEKHGAAQIHLKETEDGPLHFVVVGCYGEKAEAVALLGTLKEQDQAASSITTISFACSFVASGLNSPDGS